MDLIVYDGVCVLCSRWMRFIAAHDRAGIFRFVPLQSAFGRHLAQKFGVSVENPDSYITIIGGTLFVRSDATLAILARLPGFAWTRLLHVIPKPVRDGFYNIIARNRYRWFGRYDTCPMPPPDLISRVIEEIPSDEKSHTVPHA